MTFGAVNGLQISGYQVAVKTGTTNDKKDNWAIGWTPNLLSVVWVGNNNNSKMRGVVSGTSGAAPIWSKIMTDEERAKYLPMTDEELDEYERKSLEHIASLKKGDTLLVSFASLIPIVQAMLSEEEDQS
jgi:membrane peptidoglycan carboxypeptidase